MRVNFNYFISEAVFRYVVEAVALVAEHGWRLLPDYRFDPANGWWRHRDGAVEPPLRLAQLGYDEDGVLTLPDGSGTTAPESALAGYLEQARGLVEARPDAPPADAQPGCERRLRGLRWFELPAVCLRLTGSDDAVSAPSR